MEIQPTSCSPPNEAHSPPHNPSLTSTSSKPTLETQKKCAHCKTPAPEQSSEDEEQEKGLKPCSKCHTALYCSRDCAKAAWKTHKKTCAADAQKYALSTKEKPVAAPRVPKRDGHRGGLQKWQFDT